MKKFILIISLFFAGFIIFFEVFLRVSGLATDMQIQQYFPQDSMVLYKPGSTGKFTRGLRLEVNSDFSINPQGWNSLLNYDSVPDNAIAIIGDSYIEGGYTDVQNSLGRRIERFYPGVTVHEYGMAGANFLDYNNILKKISPKGYKLVIINFGPKDLLADRPSFTQQKGFNLERSKELYRKSAILRYINVNMQISRMISPPSKVDPAEEVSNDVLSRKFNELTFPGVVYLHESSIPDSFITDRILLKINHEVLPEDYGFNGHWNNNGYNNVAKTIAGYLKQNPIK